MSISSFYVLQQQLRFYGALIIHQRAILPFSQLIGRVDDFVFYLRIVHICTIPYAISLRINQIMKFDNRHFSTQFF
jgi:hypothetical protein